MNERTLEQALARAEIVRQPGACHFYSVATYHDALVDLILLADEVKRLRKENEDLRIELGSANAMIQAEFG